MSKKRKRKYDPEAIEAAFTPALPPVPFTGLGPVTTAVRDQLHDNLTRAMDRGEITAAPVPTPEERAWAREEAARCELSAALGRSLTPDETTIVNARVAIFDKPDRDGNVFDRDSFTDEVLAALRAQHPLRIIDVELDEDGVTATFAVDRMNDSGDYQYVTAVDDGTVSIGPFDGHTAGWVLGDRYPLLSPTPTDRQAMTWGGQQLTWVAPVIGGPDPLDPATEVDAYGAPTPLHDALWTSNLHRARVELRRATRESSRRRIFARFWRNA